MIATARVRRGSRRRPLRRWLRRALVLAVVVAIAVVFARARFGGDRKFLPDDAAGPAILEVLPAKLRSAEEGARREAEGDVRRLLLDPRRSRIALRIRRGRNQSPKRWFEGARGAKLSEALLERAGRGPDPDPALELLFELRTTYPQASALAGCFSLPAPDDRDADESSFVAPAANTAGTDLGRAALAVEELLRAGRAPGVLVTCALDALLDRRPPPDLVRRARELLARVRPERLEAIAHARGTPPPTGSSPAAEMILAERLADPAPATRRAALEEYRWRSVQGVDAALIATLREADSALAAAALRALAGLPAAVDERRVSDVVDAARTALQAARTGGAGSEARDALRDALASLSGDAGDTARRPGREAEQRTETARGAGDSADDELLAALRRLLEASSPSRLARTLEEGPVEVSTFRHLEVRAGRGEIDRPWLLAHVADIVARGVQNRRPAVRAAAWRVLAPIAPPPATLVSAFLEAETPGERAAIVDALLLAHGRAGVEATVNALIAALGASGSMRGVSLVRALAVAFPGPAVTSHVLARVDDPDPDTRAAVAYALAGVDLDERSGRALLRLLDDPAPIARYWADQALRHRTRVEVTFDPGTPDGEVRAAWRRALVDAGVLSDAAEGASR